MAKIICIKEEKKVKRKSGNLQKYCEVISILSTQALLAAGRIVSVGLSKL